MKRRFGKKSLFILGGGVLLFVWVFSPSKVSHPKFDKFVTKREQVKPVDTTPSISSTQPERKPAQIKPKRKLTPDRAKELFHQSTRYPAREHEPGELIIQGQQGRYRELADVFAVKKRDWDASDVNIEGEYLGHYLVRSNNPPNGAVKVLINEETGGYAILTNVLKVKFNRGQTDVGLFSDFSFDVVEKYEHIHLVMLKFSTSEQLVQAHEFSKAHQSIKRSTIELLEFSRTER